MTKAYSVAFERNHGPITQVLGEVLPVGARVLEVGSGPGEHAAHMCGVLEQVQWWQPSENASEMDMRRGSVEAWRTTEGGSSMQSLVCVDLLDAQWWTGHDFGQLDVLVSINVAHIVAWEGTVNLMRGASALLNAGGLVYFYGPWRHPERPFEPSNQAFDVRLRDKIEGAGIRSIDVLTQIAEPLGFELWRDVEMPSNNRSLVWRKR